MAGELPYVEVPDDIRYLVGEPLSRTRIYRQAGPQWQAAYWAKALFNAFDGLVSPGGVAMFAPVSRAAVHRRLKDGKLTGFFFYISEPYRNWFGTQKIERKLHYAYIPVCECEAWGRELQGRAVEKGLITQDELERRKPDWSGQFLEDWDSKFARERTGRKIIGG